jgi:hypothetical protein
MSNIQQEAANYLYKRSHTAVHAIVKPKPSAPTCTEPATSSAQAALETPDAVQPVQVSTNRIKKWTRETERSAEGGESEERKPNEKMRETGTKESERTIKEEDKMEKEIESEERKDEKERNEEVTKEVRTGVQTVSSSATLYQSAAFDWATEVNVADGLSPVVLININVIAPVINHPLVSTEPTTTMSNKPIAEVHKNAFGDRVPVTAVNTTSDVSIDTTLTTPILTTVHVDATVAPASLIPTSAPNLPTNVIADRSVNMLVDVAPIAPTTLAPHDFSSLHSNVRNPWGSIHYRNRRAYPLRTHCASSSTHLRLRPPHLETSSSSLDWRSRSRLPNPEPQSLKIHSHSHSTHCAYTPLRSHSNSLLEPVQTFQVIQHPKRISTTKPTITKNIPTGPALPTKTREQAHTACCTCGKTVPSQGPDRGSWRYADTRRFRRRFRRRFSWCERGRSHVWGGHL